MKIVQIEDFFHPDAGYKINILSKYFARMGHETVIITAELDKMPDFLTSFSGGIILPRATGSMSRTTA